MAPEPYPYPFPTWPAYALFAVLLRAAFFQGYRFRLPHVARPPLEVVRLGLAGPGLVSATFDARTVLGSQSVSQARQEALAWRRGLRSKLERRSHLLDPVQVQPYAEPLAQGEPPGAYRRDQ